MARSGDRRTVAAHEAVAAPAPPFSGETRGGSGSPVLGVALLLVSAGSFGAMAIFARIAYRHGADVHGVLGARFLIAATMLVALMAVTSARWPRGRDLWVLLAMGAVGYVGQSFFYFTALTRIPAGLVAVLFYTYPALVAVCSMVVTRRAPARGTVTAIVLATAGVVLIAGVQWSADAVGIALALAAAVVYTGYIMAGSRLSPQVGSLSSTAVVCLAAAAVYLGACAAHRPALPVDAAGWSGAAATAVLSTVVAIITFFAGLRLLGAAPAAAISTAEPAVTAVLAFLVLGEGLSGLQVAGAAAICVSVLFIVRGQQQPE